MSQPQNLAAKAHLDVAVQGELGRRLRAVYRGMTREPLPMEQIELVLALRRAERERAKPAIRA